MLSNNTINQIENASLDVFDAVSHIGVSTDSEQDNTQTFSGEVFRTTTGNTQKITPDNYTWETVIGLTEANGNTLRKAGLFSDSSGDNLMLSEELSQDIEKTELVELNVGIDLTLDVVDNTWNGES